MSSRTQPTEIDATSRAVSSPVAIVLTLAITVVLIIGLVVGVTGGVEQQREESVRQQLTIVGERIATELTSLDRLLYVSPNGSTSLKTRHPTRLAGARYWVTVDDSSTCSGTRCLVLNATEPSVSVTVPFRTETRVGETTVAGGWMVLTYNQSSENITVASR